MMARSTGSREFLQFFFFNDPASSCTWDLFDANDRTVADDMPDDGVEGEVDGRD